MRCYQLPIRNGYNTHCRWFAKMCRLCTIGGEENPAHYSEESQKQNPELCLPSELSLGSTNHDNFQPHSQGREAQNAGSLELLTVIL